MLQKISCQAHMSLRLLRKPRGIAEALLEMGARLEWYATRLSSYALSMGPLAVAQNGHV